MAAEVVPSRRCERCGAQGLFTEWDDDIRRYVAKCALCGHAQGAAVKQAEEAQSPKGEGRMDGTEAKKTDWRTRVPKAAEATPTVKPDGAAAKALESYHVATTRYLEASEQLRVDEQRAADAQARAKATAERLETFRSTMAEARAKLDAELALLNPDGTPKPISQRARVRTEGQERAKRHERTCLVCGVTFQAAMPTAKLCSAKCRNEWANDRRRERLAPNSPEAIENSLEAIAEAVPALAGAAV